MQRYLTDYENSASGWERVPYAFPGREAALKGLSGSQRVFGVGWE